MHFKASDSYFFSFDVKIIKILWVFLTQTSLYQIWRNYLLAFPSATDLLRLFLLMLPWLMVLLLAEGDIVAITAVGCCGESKAADVPVNCVTLIVFPC